MSLDPIEARVQSLSDEQIIDAATASADDWSPEGQAAIQRELARRGLIITAQTLDAPADRPIARTAVAAIPAAAVLWLLIKVISMLASR